MLNTPNEMYIIHIYFPSGLLSITLDYLSILVDNYCGSLHLQQLFHMLGVYLYCWFYRTRTCVTRRAFERPQMKRLMVQFPCENSTTLFFYPFNFRWTKVNQAKEWKMRRRTSKKKYWFIPFHGSIVITWAQHMNFKVAQQSSCDLLLLFVTDFYSYARQHHTKISYLNIWWGRWTWIQPQRKFTIFQWMDKKK